MHSQAPAAPRPRGKWTWWAISFGWWTLNGFASATFYRRMRDATGAQPSWGRALAVTLASAWIWVPITVGAIWLAGRYPLGRGRWRRHLPMHLAATAAVLLLRALVVIVANRWVGWYEGGLPGFGDVMIDSVENNLFLYWMLTGVAHAIHFAQRDRVRERQLAEARMQALKAQIHPHFLFNTLNTISSFVHHEPDTAERMVARLSDLLRHTLAASRENEVPLQEELEFLEPYLEIEQARFEDRLRVRWAVDPEAREARVPHLVLQPRVENALRHGLGRRAAAGTVEIGAARVGGRLRLTVRDDGAGLPEDFARRAAAGMGVANVRARLSQLYGAAHRFDLLPAEGGGAMAVIEIPYRRFTEPAMGSGRREGDGWRARPRSSMLVPSNTGGVR